MATSRDIYVKLDDWDTVKSKLQKADDAFYDVLSAYLSVLKIMVNQGVTDGNLHENLRRLYYSADALCSHAGESYAGIKGKINLLNGLQLLDSWDLERTERRNFNFKSETTEKQQNRLDKMERKCADPFTMEEHFGREDCSGIEGAIQRLEVKIMQTARENLQEFFQRAGEQYRSLCEQAEALDMRAAALDDYLTDLKAIKQKLDELTGYMGMDLGRADALKSLPVPETMTVIDKCAVRDNTGSYTYNYPEIRTILQKSEEEITYEDLVVLQGVLETMVIVDPNGNIQPDTEALSQFISAAYVKQNAPDVERLQQPMFTDLYYYFHSQAELSPAFQQLAAGTVVPQSYYTKGDGSVEITKAGTIQKLLQTVTENYSVLEWEDCWKAYDDPVLGGQRFLDGYLPRFNEACQPRITITHNIEEGSQIGYFTIKGSSFQGGDTSLEEQAKLRDRTFVESPEKFYDSGKTQIQSVDVYVGCTNSEMVNALTVKIQADYQLGKFYQEEIDVLEGKKNIFSELVDSTIAEAIGITPLGHLRNICDAIDSEDQLMEDAEKVKENNRTVDRAFHAVEDNYLTEGAYASLGLHYNTMTAVKTSAGICDIFREDMSFDPEGFSKKYANNIQNLQSYEAGYENFRIVSSVAEGEPLTSTELAVYESVLSMRLEDAAYPTAENITPLLPETADINSIPDIDALIMEFNIYIDQYTEATGMTSSTILLLSEPDAPEQAKELLQTTGTLFPSENHEDSEDDK